VNRAIWKVFKQRGVKIPVAQREFRMLSDSDRQRPRPSGPGDDAGGESDPARPRDEFRS
jgi:hypothetical protein